MGWNPFRRSEPQAAISEGLLTALLMGESSATRSTFVTPDTALTSTAVLACLIVRAETIGSLPAHVYRRDGDSRILLGEHPVSRLLARRWNELLTASEGWRWEQLTEDVRGQAFVRVEYSGGRPVALWPMTGNPPRLGRTDAGRYVYEYDGDAQSAADTYPLEEVLHFRGPIIRDGVNGASLVSLAAQSVGISIDAERFYARLLTNGQHFPGYLQTEEKLADADLKALAEQLKGKSGVFSAGELRIFDRGLKYVSNPMSIKDAQLTEEQTWVLQQVCRVFRVPPPMVQDFSNSTYTNSEQADLWFTKHTIRPLAVNKERVIARIFERSREDLRGVYARFELDGLLRGDFATRSEGYSKLITAGVMTRNQVRELEDWDPIDGLDKPLLPLNATTVADDGSTEEPVRIRRETVDAFTPLVSDAVARIRLRAAQDADRGREPSATLAFADQVLAPIAEAYRLAGLEFDADAVAASAVEGAR